MSTGAKPEQCFIEFVVKASCPEDSVVDCLWQSDVFACRVSGSVCLGFGVLFLFLRFGCFVWFWWGGGLWGDGFGLILYNCFR